MTILYLVYRNAAPHYDAYSLNLLFTPNKIDNMEKLKTLLISFNCDNALPRCSTIRKQRKISIVQLHIHFIMCCVLTN